MMKKIAVTVCALFLASCATLNSPKKAKVEGHAPPSNVQLLELDKSVRDLLGARNKDDLIIRVGSDGTITFFGSSGQGFLVEATKDGKPGDDDILSQFTITTIRSKSLTSVTCHYTKIGGVKIWDPVPPCPIQ
jgi:hypothetical protein